MNRFNRFSQPAALCALLLCFSLTALADDIQDANKLFKHGQLPQALAKIDGYLLTKPKDAQARFLKGVILTDQGQLDEATRIFTALTVDYPDLPEPYNNLAVIYAGQGQYDKAKTELETAIRTHPSYATAHENLGDIYAKMASQAYDRALQLDRSNASSKTKLALVKELFSNNAKTHLASSAQPALITAAAPTASTVSATPAAATPPAATASAPVAAKIELVPPKPVVTTTVTSGANDEIQKALHDWSKAWSSKNMNAYLAAYARDFKTPGNETRSTWEKQRRERIVKPQPIAVSISNTKIKMTDDTHATVSFIQFYRSGTLKSTSHKTLEMIKHNNSWQIQSEKTGR